VTIKVQYSSMSSKVNISNNMVVLIVTDYCGFVSVVSLLKSLPGNALF
jgi:hypothetical protein